MQQSTALMGLITETPLHAGAGSSLDVIDLPIQREGHNGWPCVYGSAMKGALRDHAYQQWKQDPRLEAVFGPDRAAGAPDNAGALAVGDARLLLLPVRSLTTAFRWVTCPEALTRFQRDAGRLGLEDRFSFRVPQAKGIEALAGEGGQTLFLEEYRLETRSLPEAGEIAGALALLVNREDFAEALAERLTLVGDDLFTTLTRNATTVAAHVALDSATKTTAGNALWYEETLPPETLLYVPLVAAPSRKRDDPTTADEILGAFKGLFEEGPWVQVGGNETVGMGWCGLRFVGGE